jgi:hypothetical protein
MKGEIDEDKRKLVDILFQCVITTHMEKKSFKNKTVEEMAEWTARQLRECGFETVPLGSSWGHLTGIKK